jgi:Undecaprenyl-phosphate glucose phosphotransferase
MSTDYLKTDFRLPENSAHGRLQGSLQPPAYRTISYRTVTPLAMICDALLIFSTSVLSGAIYNFAINGVIGDVTTHVGFAAVVAALFIAWGKIREVYTLTALLNFKSQIRMIAITWPLVFLFLTAIGFVMKVGGHFSRGTVLCFATSGLVALIAARAGWRIFLADGLAVRRFSNRRVGLIAEQEFVEEPGLLGMLARHGLQPVQQFILSADRNNTKQHEKVIAQAVSSLRGSDVEEVVVAADLDHWPDLSGLLSELRVLPLPVHLVPAGQMAELFRLPSHAIGENVTIELQRGPRTLFERAVKRISDLVIASIALVALMPLFLMTAVAIKLDSPGPIIFRQWRRGFNGRPFQILKFRTMSVLEDGENIVQAEPNDVRITPIGSWLRRTSIDELPQLINVLQGNMSAVGPRPHAMAHDNQFDKIVGNYAYRHHVKPGLTGWAQVHGYRGQTPTVWDVEQRIKLDLWYIDNWNLALDLKILFMTATELLFGKNAY